MTDTKISALTDATSVADADEIPIVQGGVTKRATRAEVLGTVLAATTASYTTAEQTKLSGIATGATVYTDEMARDAIGSALVAGSNVTITVNDAGDTITVAATGGGGSEIAPNNLAAFPDAGYWPLLGGLYSSSVGDSFGSTSGFVFPFRIEAEVTFDALSCDVITASAGVTRKFYIGTVSGSTITPVANTAGSWDMSSVAYVTQVLAGSVTLAAGSYVLCMKNSGGGTQMRCFARASATEFGISAPAASIHTKGCHYGSDSTTSYANWGSVNGVLTAYATGGENIPWVIARKA